MKKFILSLITNTLFFFGLLITISGEIEDNNVWKISGIIILSIWLAYLNYKIENK